MSRDHQITIMEAHRFQGGVLIRFSDDSTTFFHGDFLHSVRDDEGNMPFLVADAEFEFGEVE